jgi:hypothetical protein
MANPYFPEDPYRSRFDEDEARRARELDTRLQVDPEMDEAPASNGRIALYALGIAVLLGAVFYALNNTSVQNAGTAPPIQTSQSQPAAPGMAPRPNTAPGMTTGAAPSRPTAPQSQPSGTDADRAKSPDGNNGAPPASQNNDQR